MEQSGEKIRAFLESESDRWNKRVDEILNIHLKTPSPKRQIVFIPKPFDTSKPVSPSQKQVGFLDKFIKSRQEAIQRENEIVQQKYERELEKWEKARHEHEQSENKRKWLIEMGRYSDTEKMQELLEYVFAEIEFPRETLFLFR